MSLRVNKAEKGNSPKQTINRTKCFTIFLFQEAEAYRAPQIPSFIWPQMAYMPISDPTAAAAALIQASVAARVALEVGLVIYFNKLEQTLFSGTFKICLQLIQHNFPLTWVFWGDPFPLLVRRTASCLSQCTMRYGPVIRTWSVQNKTKFPVLHRLFNLIMLQNFALI